MYADEITLTGEVTDAYVRNIPVVRFLQQGGRISLTSPVTIFVGENGTGKSTLLEAVAIALGFNPEGGSRNFTFSTVRAHSDLYRALTVGRTRHPKDGFFLRAESFFNLATDIDRMDGEPSLGAPVINSYGGVSLHEQSHGESFLSLARNRFGGHGLYILDEPEAALSPMRLLSLMATVRELTEKDSQFIIATHSPILMTYPGAQILSLTENGVEETDYRQTEHYQLTRRMMENPESVFRHLFSK